MKLSGFRKAVIGLAIVIILVPALGFPQTWENSYLVFAGLAIIALLFAEVYEKPTIVMEEEDEVVEEPVVSEKPEEENWNFVSETEE